MISGSKIKKIESYFIIDRLAEGYGPIKPKEDESFIGIPYQWYSDDCLPFIEIYKGDVLVATVNCSDISEIKFKEE